MNVSLIPLVREVPLGCFPAPASPKPVARLLGGGFAWILCLSGLSGATLELAPVRDAVLYDDATGGSANGSGAFLLAGRTNQASDSRRRSLLQFDFSTVPPGATVTAVTLRLHLVTVTTADSSVGLHRVTTPWTAGPSDPPGSESAGLPPVAGDATWIHARFPSLWDFPGGDFAAGASASALVTSAAGFFEWSGAGILGDVRAWIDQPEQNFGWLLKGDESLPQTAKRFDSADSAAIEFRPVLVLDYTPVPEPGVGALLGLPVLLSFLRRKRNVPRGLGFFGGFSSR